MLEARPGEPVAHVPSDSGFVVLDMAVCFEGKPWRTLCVLTLFCPQGQARRMPSERGVLDPGFVRGRA